MVYDSSFTENISNMLRKLWIIEPGNIYVLKNSFRNFSFIILRVIKKVI